ncbi:MAG: methyltransferase domain-containing protein, partial [Candidatus Paceibacterota bacterium]
SCPVDDVPMEYEGTAVRCVNGHSFDISREGYVNLMPRRKKLHETIGDNKEMLAAREHFLEAGHYDTLVREINRLIKNNLTKPRRDTCALEVGSGTGYYLRKVMQKLSQPDICYFGSDISKEATQFSAKQNPDATFLVADTHEKIPIKSNSVQLLLDIFSPRNKAEFQRLLADNGFLLIVIPGETHLKEIIPELGLIGYEEEKSAQIKNDYQNVLTLLKNTALEYPITLTAESLRDLVKMGPNHWRFSADMNKKIQQIAPVEVTASFEIFLYRNNL